MGKLTSTGNHNQRVASSVRRDLQLATAGSMLAFGLAVVFAWRLLRLAGRQLQRMDKS